MPQADSAVADTETKKFTVDTAKLAADSDFQTALKTALERYGAAGGDTSFDCVTVIVVVTNSDGRTGAADCGPDLEDYQIKEMEEASAAED